jgi:hypothetical protein
MAKIDSGSKSSRLLASRRYTHDTLTSAQESFTEVLDLGASEIYTQANSIPSSGLPYSGSSQQANTYTNQKGDSIMKYWYRQKLTKSNTNNEVWFFLNPTGSDSGIGAQLIDSNQHPNFVSPKYSIAGLATSTTEDSTPGYLATLLNSTSLNSGSLSSDDIVSTNDYQFDYKTGIIQFMNSSVDPGGSDYLYMTVYQYVGKTLATGLELDGGVSGSATSTGSFGYVKADRVEATEYIVSSSVTNISVATLSGSTQFGDDHTDIHQFTGSVKFDSTLFNIYDASDELMFKVQNKMAILGTITGAAPTAVAGGIYYSGSDAWYLGYETAPT